MSNGRLHNYGIGILPMKTVNISLGFIGSLGCCSSKVGRFTQKISKDLAPKSRPSIFFLKSFESKKKRLQKHSEMEHSKERKARRKKSMFRKLFIQTIMEDTESQIWPIEISITTCNVNLRKVFLTQARPE